MISPWPVTVDELTFRTPVEADIPSLLAVRNLPEVNRFMVRTYVDPDELRREVLANPTSARDHTCVVERDGRVVATGFLQILDAAGQPGVPEGTEGLIGYVVDPAEWGRGVATATVPVLLRAAFEVLGLRRVAAGASLDNVASVRALERAGVRHEQHEVKALWDAELGWIDVVGYAMLADEWRARS